ncbi:MAG TPA: 50S ribosomal protein L13 [Leptospiraceae bacterium]|nr:50S ribosomal protein L13 [Leptospiraceae bacterium]HMY65907.1 50S ribosomal protein L13 [Leptospiraceae bacterium]HMZ59595.1 50S ribosomal protein L13 [Leptospiraceae bacterium]HNF16029.1 50S ribosomal protein L13 [Leptospiraceae bacterium]HNF24694.1 50S ribosomal protein L13 [Leptospiraceae bacterium]
MPTISPIHRTPSIRKEDVQKKWYVVDAEGKTLGRLCSAIAARLRGKHKPTFTPNQDCGDNIIVINAEKIKVTGRKTEQKIYRHHSRFPGGLSEIKFRDLVKENPVRIITEGVKGMLPKTKLGNKMITHCRVFAGPEHDLAAQKPVKLEL